MDTSRESHPSTPRTAAAVPPDAVDAVTDASVRRDTLADCCSAPSARRVVLASARPDSVATDLMFCEHHFRIHAAALVQAGAVAS